MFSFSESIPPRVYRASRTQNDRHPPSVLSPRSRLRIAETPVIRNSSAVPVMISPLSLADGLRGRVYGKDGTMRSSEANEREC